MDLRFPIFSGMYTLMMCKGGMRNGYLRLSVQWIMYSFRGVLRLVLILPGGASSVVIPNTTPPLFRPFPCSLGVELKVIV